MRKLVSVNKVFKISVYIATLCGSLAVASFLTLNVFTDMYQSNVHRDFYEFEPVNYVVIEALNVDVDVQCWDGDKIQIYYNCDAEAEIEQLGSKITLKQQPSFVISLFAFDKYNYGITVKLPRERYKKLSVSSNSGDITVCGIPCDVLDISAKSGDVLAEDISSQLLLYNEKGYSNLNFSEFEQQAIIETESGKADVHLPESADYFLHFTTENGVVFSDKEKLPLRKDISKAYGASPVKLAISTTDGVVSIKSDIKEG